MRMFGLASLVLVLSIVGFLVAKQTTGRKAIAMPGATTPELGVRAQSRQMPSDVQRALGAVTREPRLVPDEP